MKDLGIGNTYVVPEGHDKNHRGLESIAHTTPSTLLLEVIGILKDLLLLGAEVSSKRVSGNSSNLGLRVGNDVAVLDIETSDLRETAVGSLVELGDDGDLLGGIDSEVGSGTVEGLVALAVGVEVTAISIASSAIAVVGVGSTARVTFASMLSELGARVRSVGSGDGVGLPDVHLGAAGTDVTLAGVGVVLRAVPALDVSLTVDPLDIVGALSIAVSWNLLEN